MSVNNARLNQGKVTEEQQLVYEIQKSCHTTSEGSF